MKRTVSSVKASCDRTWSKIVRAGGICERCGTTPASSYAFHAHHVYGRKNHRLRFEPRNGCALCYTCHRWAEEHVLDFADWFREVRPADAKWLQAENRKGILQRNINDYLKLEDDLKARLTYTMGTA